MEIISCVSNLENDFVSALNTHFFWFLFQRFQTLFQILGTVHNSQEARESPHGTSIFVPTLEQIWVGERELVQPQMEHRDTVSCTAAGLCPTAYNGPFVETSRLKLCRKFSSIGIIMKQKFSESFVTQKQSPKSKSPSKNTNSSGQQCWPHLWVCFLQWVKCFHKWLLFFIRTDRCIMDQLQPPWPTPFRILVQSMRSLHPSRH